jgi:trans-aconitate 2-methyltransferase
VNEQEHWLSLRREQFVEDQNVALTDELAAITSAFPARPRKILEIGCGYGRLTEEVALLYPEAHVVGMDINAALFPFGGYAAYWTRDDRDDAPFDLSGFDAVYSVTVFQHLPHQQQFEYIRDAYNMLLTGGVLRVQFIDDEADGFLDHHLTAAQMQHSLHLTGFTGITVERGLAHPQWAWITGVK